MKQKKEKIPWVWDGSTSIDKYSVLLSVLPKYVVDNMMRDYLHCDAPDLHRTWIKWYGYCAANALDDSGAAYRAYKRGAKT